jgi:hypothetical protein
MVEADFGKGKQKAEKCRFRAQKVANCSGLSQLNSRHAAPRRRRPAYNPACRQGHDMMGGSTRLLALAGCAITLLVFAHSRIVAAPACFTASRQYRIRPAHGGSRGADGWKVTAGSFALCVRRQEAAEKALRLRYPGDRYALTPAATIGCHAC